MLREPLPYPHVKPVIDRDPVACTVPEGGTDGHLFPSLTTCPGCRAWAIARTIAAPNETVISPDGPSRRVDRMRVLIDEFDPMRVLFERALVERGIA